MCQQTILRRYNKVRMRIFDTGQMPANIIEIMRFERLVAFETPCSFQEARPISLSLAYSRLQPDLYGVSAHIDSAIITLVAIAESVHLSIGLASNSFLNQQ